MKIAIPTILTTSQAAGIGNYIASLIEELQQIDQKNEYYIITFPDNRHLFKLQSPNFHEIIIPIKQKSRTQLRLFYLYWQSRVFPVLCKQYGIDLVHIPTTWFCPAGLRVVITIHDVTEFKTKRYNYALSRFKQLMVKSAVKKAKCIIAVSETTADDLKKLGGKRVVTIHNGFDNPFVNFSMIDGKHCLQKYGLLNESYVLFVGALQRHKNIPTLIRAFHKTFDKLPHLKLVIAGKKDNGYREIVKTIRELSVEDSVIMPGYVPENEKWVLIKNCTVMVLISTYEGFGFPILEAQAAGVPILASNTSSIPEIAGNGAVLENPKDVNKLAEHLYVLCTDPLVRANVKKRGAQNIDRFSWFKCAEKTLAVYEQCMDSS